MCYLQNVVNGKMIAYYSLNLVIGMEGAKNGWAFVPKPGGRSKKGIRIQSRPCYIGPKGKGSVSERINRPGRNMGQVVRESVFMQAVKQGQIYF